MINGLLAGITWALETVIIGIVLTAASFTSNEEALLLAPFVSTFLHDAVSAVLMWIYNGIRGGLKDISAFVRTSDFKWLILASAVGGPVGMTGYVLTVNYMGASVGAVASAIYPAVGSVLAYIFLKEKIKWYQWIFLALTLIGVFGLSYTPGLDINNFWLGALGTLMCAFGWGIEGVILSKCLKSDNLKSEQALLVRQTTSAVIYGAVLLPILGGWRLTAGLFTSGDAGVLATVAAAAFFATVSYLFYYRAIAKLGVSKAMGLNITYTAWAMLFSVFFLGNRSILTPMTVICAAVVVICGVFAATDPKLLFESHRKEK